MTLKMRLTRLVIVVGLSVGLAACKSPAPTAAPTGTAAELPTRTAVPPSATPLPPVDSALPPTETAQALPAPTLGPPTAVPSARVMVKLLNVRSGPSTAYTIVAIVKEGDVLTAIGRSPDGQWILVNMPDGKSGWCSASSRYVALDADVSQLPAAPVPPPPAAPAPTATLTLTP